MAVVVTEYHKLLPSVTLRASEAITGGSGEEIRQLLDNATRGYAQSQVVLVEGGGIVDVSDWQDSARPGAITVIEAWVELDENADKITFNAAGDDIDLRIRVFDTVARTSTLYDSGTIIISGGPSEITPVTTGALSDTSVLILVEFQYRGAGGTPGKLISVIGIQAPLVAGDLPT